MPMAINAQRAKAMTLTFCFALLLIAPSFLVDLGNAQYEPAWYAGYWHYGFETEAGEGVLGDIVTINPTVTAPGFAEMIDIALSYTLDCWLQVGYVKFVNTSYHLRYYFERNDSVRYQITYSGSGPSPGSWHTYYLVRPYSYGGSSDPTRWNCYLDGALQLSWYVNPYLAVDQLAFVETHDRTIHVDRSHFKSLSHFTFDKDWKWMLWYEHLGWADKHPYLTQTSGHEFYAYGGA